MKQDLVVKKKITIKADPSKVWDALTKPEFTKKYFFDCEVFSDIGKAEGAEERYKKSDKGWDSVLKGLKELLENPN